MHTATPADRCCMPPAQLNIVLTAEASAKVDEKLPKPPKPGEAEQKPKEQVHGRPTA